VLFLVNQACASGRPSSAEGAEDDQSDAAEGKPKKWSHLVAPLGVTLVALAVVFASASVAPATAKTTTAPSSGSDAASAQPRIEVWVDVSKSTARPDLRHTYVTRVMKIVDEAIDHRAYLRIRLFGGAASNAVMVIDRAMEARGPNASYVAAAKRRAHADVERLVRAALLKPRRVKGPQIAGSDPFGAVRYGVIAAKAGLAARTPAALWVLTDGHQAWRKTNLVRLLRHRPPRQVVRRWLKPYVTYSSGVAVHVRGLNQSNPPTVDIRVATRVETTFKLFCGRLRATSCDVTGEV